MVKYFALIMFLMCSHISNAALAPKYQNMKDLEVMVEFVKKHEKVMSTLKTIDFENFTVYFGTDCKITFERKVIPKPSGWAGPAAPLVFNTANCSLN